MGEEPDTIRAEIEETRERMGDTVDALAYKADVKTRAKESVSDKVDTLKSKVTGAGDSVRESVVGAPDSVAEATPSGDEVKHRAPGQGPGPGRRGRAGRRPARRLRSSTSARRRITDPWPADAAGQEALAGRRQAHLAVLLVGDVPAAPTRRRCASIAAARSNNKRYGLGASWEELSVNSGSPDRLHEGGDLPQVMRAYQGMVDVVTEDLERATLEVITQLRTLTPALHHRLYIAGVLAQGLSVLAKRGALRRAGGLRLHRPAELEELVQRIVDQGDVPGDAARIADALAAEVRPAYSIQREPRPFLVVVVKDPPQLVRRSGVPWASPDEG
jgi:phage tail protein X